MAATGQKEVIPTMQSYQPGGWGKRLVNMLLLVLGLAVVARVIYELLAPLLPLMIALLILATAYLATTQQWRRRT
ncbi:MAG: hypothetical protein OJF49_001047 [Ktedonobacterales bacterium]|nr:MAG: hypothetical protein OJF49_001047 [Ktedonobacterales bacterium]